MYTEWRLVEKVPSRGDVSRRRIVTRVAAAAVVAFEGGEATILAFVERRGGKQQRAKGGRSQKSHDTPQRVDRKLVRADGQSKPRLDKTRAFSRQVSRRLAARKR